MIAGSDHVVGIVSMIDGGMRRIGVDGHVRISELSDARASIEKGGFDREYRPEIFQLADKTTCHSDVMSSPSIPVCSLVSSENT